MKKYKAILLSCIMVFTLTGCEKEQNGKAVVNEQEVELSDDSKENTTKKDKTALDIIDGKFIISETDYALYPVITCLGKDYYQEYIHESDGPSFEIIEVKSDDKKVTYELESTYYETVQYEQVTIEIIDANTVNYIYGDSEPTKCKLSTKTEVAMKMKEVEEKVANGFTIQDKTGDYIISDSSSRKLTESDLSSYNKTELGYIRNEIFARHGYVFKNEDYQNYFGQKSWYFENPTFSGNIEDLSTVEKHNINLIKKLEGEN